jgi:hypothetical protein
VSSSELPTKNSAVRLYTENLPVQHTSQCSAVQPGCIASGGSSTPEAAHRKLAAWKGIATATRKLGAPLFAQFHAVRRHVNDGKLRARAREFDGGGAQAAADLQDTLTLNRRRRAVGIPSEQKEKLRPIGEPSTSGNPQTAVYAARR